MKFAEAKKIFFLENLELIGRLFGTGFVKRRQISCLKAMNNFFK